jgi:competence protein ComEC
MQLHRSGRSHRFIAEDVSSQTSEKRQADLRLLLPALTVWSGALLGTSLSAPATALVTVAVVATSAGIVLHRGVRGLIALAALSCFVVAAASGAARMMALDRGPVAGLADVRAHVAAQVVLIEDPVVRRGTTGQTRTYAVARARIEHIGGRGQSSSVRAPVLLVGGSQLLTAVPGQRLRISGRLAPADASEGLAALLRATRPPTVVGNAPWVQRWTEPLRQGLRDSVDDLPAGPRGLIPALVVGDRSGLPPEVTDDMRAAGLLHLNAVSGTNVAIILAAVLAVARATGVRSYGLPTIAGTAVVAFVVLARPQPSVLRAAVMGLVVLLAHASGGTRRGLVALAAAVFVLVLVDPFLARSVGFSLSVLATAGILVLAPRWTNAMAVWFPQSLAAAVAVPLAAQLACTPLIVTVSGQLSVVAVFANLLVAPAVAPATVFGAAAAVTAPLWSFGGTLLGFGAGLPAWWIVAVAHGAAAFPGAAVGVPTGGIRHVCGAIAVTVLAAWAISRALRSRWVTVGLATVLVLAIRQPERLSWLQPGSSWPPSTWVIAACAVGQGDALAIRTGPDAAVVVDAGPDPRLVDRCLDDLRIRTIPVLVLTHFHADHVAGVSGVFAERSVAQLLVSPLHDPPAEAARVQRLAQTAGVPVAEARAGTTQDVGEVSWEVLWPKRLMRDTDSPPNNASIVLKAHVAGVSVLLTGDIEPEAQSAILRSGVDVRADILKVPHHGSSHQDDAFLRAVRPSVALVSVGADNPHGHPSPRVGALLQRSGAVVIRTDQRGSVAVTPDGSHVRIAASGPLP